MLLSIALVYLIKNDISRIGRIVPLCTDIVAAVGTEPWTL